MQKSQINIILEIKFSSELPFRTMDVNDSTGAEQKAKLLCGLS